MIICMSRPIVSNMKEAFETNINVTLLLEVLGDIRSSLCLLYINIPYKFLQYCSFGLRYVSLYKYLIVSLVFSHLGFWSGNLFLIAPFSDLCLLVHFFIGLWMTSFIPRIFHQISLFFFSATWVQSGVQKC